MSKSACGEWIIKPSPQILASERKATTFENFCYYVCPFCIIHHDILSLRYVDVQCFMLCYVSYCSQMNFLLESMKLYCGMVTNSPAVNFSRPENTVWEDPRLSDSLWLSQTIKVLPAINVHFSTLQGPVTSMLNICSHFLSGFLLQTLQLKSKLNGKSCRIKHHCNVCRISGYKITSGDWWTERDK